MYNMLFNTIPNEILLHIFKYISIKDGINIMLVNKRFKKIFKYNIKLYLKNKTEKDILNIIIKNDNNYFLLQNKFYNLKHKININNYIEKSIKLPFYLLHKGLFNTFQYLLNEKLFDINIKNNNNQSLLYISSSLNNYNLCNLLIKNNIDINLDVINKSFLCPIHDFIHDRSHNNINYLIINYLFNQNFNIDIIDVEKRTFFHISILKKNYIFATYLIYKNCNINTVDIFNNSPLFDYINASNKNLYFSKKIINYANIDLLDKYGNTTLISAINRNNYLLVELILKKNNMLININDYENNTPLMIAYEFDNLKIINFILTYQK